MLRWLLTIALWAATLPLVAATLPNRPVDKLDLARYSGQWHEIAHLPMRFEKKCVSDVVATYTLGDNGSIVARYSCRTRSGRTDDVHGTAKRSQGQPAGAFKVRFVPRWLAWLPKMWGDYWVIDLDPDYRWAVIGGPGGEHLWVMARRPGMQRQLFERIRQRAQQRGYPVDKLILTAPLE
ncbi:MAG: lipocalin family protein [Rhodanobacter sp.]